MTSIARPPQTCCRSQLASCLIISLKTTKFFCLSCELPELPTLENKLLFPWIQLGTWEVFISELISRTENSGNHFREVGKTYPVYFGWKPGHFVFGISYCTFLHASPFCLCLSSLSSALCSASLGTTPPPPQHTALRFCCGLVAKLCLTLETPRTVAYQAPLSMGFSRQECWSGVRFFLSGSDSIGTNLNPIALEDGSQVAHLSLSLSSSASTKLPTLS